VNPLFRAAYLAKSAKQSVTLVVPWLCKSDQELVYPNSMTFSSPEEQEAYIRSWLEERIGFKANFEISFYPGKVLVYGTFKSKAIFGKILFFLLELYNMCHFRNNLQH
jgi:hypothetical protein